MASETKEIVPTVTPVPTPAAAPGETPSAKVEEIPTAKIIFETATKESTAVTDHSMQVAWINNLGILVSSWPLAIAIIVFILRDPIKWLIKQRWKLKYAGVEATIDDEIESNLSTAPDAEPDASQPPPAFDVSDLTERAPMDAIITAWVQVERAQKVFVAARGLNSKKIRTGLPPRELIQELSDHDADLLRELRSIRNRVVHEGDSSMTPASIKLYAERAVQLSQVIESLATKRG